MSILLCLGLLAVQSDDLRAKVDALAAKLASDDLEEREDASQALVRLGMDAEPHVRAALAGAKEPDVRARLMAALQCYVPQREEKYALELLKAPQPMPTRDEAAFSIGQDETVADVVERVAKTFRLKVEFYAEDQALRDDAAARRMGRSITYRTASPEQPLFAALTEALEATFVVDGEGVVIVRLTPDVMFRRYEIDNAGLARDRICVHECVDELLSPRRDHWKTMCRFIQSRGERPGESRTKWLQVLSAVARDRLRPDASRMRALEILTWYYGVNDDPQPDATAVFLAVRRDGRSSVALREEASLDLAHCGEVEAQDAVLDDLAKGSASLRRRLLLRLGVLHRNLGALKTIQEAPARKAAFDKALAEVESGGDRGLALRATSLRAMLREAGAAALLVKAEEPPDLETAMMVVEGLRVAAFDDPAAVMERLDRFAKSRVTELRAAAGCAYGRSAGGVNRERDVEGALSLLADPEALVRCSAAEAIGTIYSRSASTPWRTNAEACLKRVREASAVEKDVRVREALERAEATLAPK